MQCSCSIWRILLTNSTSAVCRLSWACPLFLLDWCCVCHLGLLGLQWPLLLLLWLWCRLLLCWGVAAHRWGLSGSWLFFSAAGMVAKGTGAGCGGRKLGCWSSGCGHSQEGWRCWGIGFRWRNFQGSAGCEGKMLCGDAGMRCLLGWGLLDSLLLSEGLPGVLPRATYLRFLANTFTVSLRRWTWSWKL